MTSKQKMEFHYSECIAILDEISALQSMSQPTDVHANIRISTQGTKGNNQAKDTFGNQKYRYSLSRSLGILKPKFRGK
jgi:hypothetical protein